MERQTLTQKLETVLTLFPFMKVELLGDNSLVIHTGEHPSHLALDNALDHLEDLQLIEEGE